MGNDELFDAISHPIRIDMIKLLSENPLRFADLKRKLKISSSGLLDFHLKKLDDLVVVNKEGCYGFGLLVSLIVSFCGMLLFCLLLLLGLCSMLIGLLLREEYVLDHSC